MKIECVHLIGFGKFANRDFELQKDFQVILGSNEAGKTTLVNAIFGVLYGFKGRSDDIRQMKARYRPWNQELPYLAGITFTDAKSNKYKVLRNFEQDKVEVQLWHENSFIPAGKTLEQLLEEVIGLKSMRLFESTLLIRQEELSILDKTNLSEGITQKITEGGQDVLIRDVFKTLEEQQKELTRGMDRPALKTGQIKTLEDQIKEIKFKITQLEQHELEYYHLKNQLKNNGLTRAENEKRLLEIEPMTEEYQKRRILLQNRNDLSAEQKETQTKLNKILEKQNQLAQCEEALDELKAAAPYLTVDCLESLEQLSIKNKNTEEAIKKLHDKIEERTLLINETKQKIVILAQKNNHYLQVKYNQANLTEAQRVSDLLNEYRESLDLKEKEYNNYTGNKKINTKLWPGIVLIILSQSGFLFNGLPGYTLAGVFLLSGTLLLVLNLIKNNQGNENKNLISHLEKELERLNINISNNQHILSSLIGDESLETYKARVNALAATENEKNLLENKLSALDTNSIKEEINHLLLAREEVQQDINRILQKSQVANLTAFKDKLARYNKIKNDQRLYKETIDAITEGRPAEYYTQKLSELSVELLKINQDINSIGTDISNEEFEQFTREKENLKTAKEDLATQLVKIETQLNHYNENLFKGQDIWSLRDSLAEKEKELAKFQKQQKSLELTISVMKEAVKEAQGQLAPAVESDATRIFSYITSGRYQKVDIGIEEGKLYFRVLAPERGDFIDASDLSTGTRDQFYLALRVSLGEYITGKKEFPLFLDDPFINFDEGRMMKTIELLRELAGEKQIIWLTKDVSFADSLSGVALTYL